MRPRSRLALVAFLSLLHACGDDTAATRDAEVPRDGALDAPSTPSDAQLPDDAGHDVPSWIGATHATTKIRPDGAVPSTRHVRIEAARNEWEPYQLVFAGGERGRSIVEIRPSDLVGPSGAHIPASRSFVHVEGLIDVPTPSNAEGAAGRWPDALLPVVDLVHGETRDRVLPLDVAADEVRAAWIDVLVPEDAPAGEYIGSVQIVTADERIDVPVALRVFDFALPSTATLRTMFGSVDDTPCIAHHDGPWSGNGWSACQDSDPVRGGDWLTEYYRTLYMRFALEYRISLGQSVYLAPRDEAGLAHFDATYGPLLEGTADTHLRGAKLTTLAVPSNGPPNTTIARTLADHAAARGWHAQLFDYTWDEPESLGSCPTVGSCPVITTRASTVRSGGVRPLVTAQLAYAERHGFADVVDILVPVLNFTREPSVDYPYHQARGAYDAWLEGDARRELWWYQSCMSHGCGGERGVCGSASQDVGGFPSYVIDASAVQARAMEWLSFTHDMGGELYFATTYTLTTAWEDQCAFSGAGDGNLLYPGTPERLGGTSHVPVASIRFALVREGLEDYEYLHLLASRGGAEEARRIATTLFPEIDRVTTRSGDELMAARRALAEAIEAR